MTQKQDSNISMNGIPATALPNPEVTHKAKRRNFMAGYKRTLLDEGEHLCSVSTMYRILNANDEVRERRDQKRHPAYKKPELVATVPSKGLFPTN